MSPVAFLVPTGVHDERHPSGGNRYDVELAAALRLTGWRARMIEVAAEPDAIAAAVADVPGGDPILVDGLLLETGIGTSALEEHRFVPLLHMPPVSGAALGLLGRADAVVTTSGWTRDRVREHVPSATPLAVALPGVRPTRLVSTSPTGRRIRCVGAVAPHKGQDVLVEALGRLAHRTWRCELVGPTDVDPAFVRSVRDLAARLGIADRVALTGPRHANPLDGLYSGCDLLVLPSRAESYGMVVAEALACGVPVIASATGGVREALDPSAGLLVRPGDPDGLAAALDAWLTREDLRRRLTAGARSCGARRRTWSSAAALVADRLAAAPALRTAER